jgi:hypothetical protein
VRLSGAAAASTAGAVLVASLLVLAATSTASGPEGTPNKPVAVRCPRQVMPLITMPPQVMSGVARAVRTQVPHVFAHLTSMGHPAWPHFQVAALIVLRRGELTLGSEPPIRGLGRYARVATRACGSRTAAASVLVLLEFPYCQLPCAFGWAYATRTRNGWRLWTSYQV